MISISDLLASPTGDEVLEKYLSMLETIGVAARSWREGGGPRTILRIVANAQAELMTSLLAFVRAGFLETSEGGWLTLLAYSVYLVTRISATFATGTVTLTNAGGGIYTLLAGELVVGNLLTGKTYTNLADFTLNPGVSLPVDVRAIEQGSASNGIPGAVTKMVSVLAGVTVTNAAAIVGSNEELDADLRARCLNRLAIIGGKGPRGAYAFAVKSAVRGDGSPVDINRQRIVPNPLTGVVSVYVASPAGAPAGTDLPFIVAAIEQYARPDSVTAAVVAAAPVALTASITVWAKRQDGLTAPDLGTLVQASLLAMIQSYPIGGIAKPPSTQGYLYADGIAGAAKAAHPAIFDVDGVGGDLALAANEVATLATTVDVRLVEVST